jgi:hypothetical protein
MTMVTMSRHSHTTSRGGDGRGSGDSAGGSVTGIAIESEQPGDQTAAARGAASMTRHGHAFICHCFVALDDEVGFDVMSRANYLAAFSGHETATEANHRRSTDYVATVMVGVAKTAQIYHCKLAFLAGPQDRGYRKCADE